MIFQKLKDLQNNKFRVKKYKYKYIFIFIKK